MSNLAYGIIYPQPRKLTLGVALALSLFSLTVNAQTVVRTGSGSTVSGNDIGEVQNAPGAAEGDVIKVSDGAAFNTDVTNPVNNFTIESASNNVINVPVQAGYNFTQTPTDPFNATFRNVSFTGAENYTSHFWIGDVNQSNIIGITIDGNVSFSNFKSSVFDYYQTTSTIYPPYKFTCTNGSTLTFSGNTTADYGAAIRQLYELNGNGSFMTFSNNTAGLNGGAIDNFRDLSGSGNTIEFSNNTAEKGCGGAVTHFSLSGSGNTLKFEGNTAEELYGGAIRSLTDLTGDNNKLTFSKNTANGTEINDGGGAIYNLTNLSGSGNILDFSENTAKSGGAIYRLGYSDGTLGLTGNNNQLTFSNNKANGTDAAYVDDGGGAIYDGGGAIYQLDNLSGSGNILDFSENTAAKSGGAIYQLGYWDGTTFSGGLTGNNNKLTFSNNKANGTGDTDGGGAIWKLSNLSGSGNTLEFSENTAAKFGGAIYELTKLSGSGNTLEFTGNTTGHRGGAIDQLSTLSGSGNTLEFSGNSAEMRGGAINNFWNLSGSGNTLKFTGNTAKYGGGAIYELTYLPGSGNTLTFTGNTAGEYGGAIYQLTSLPGSGNTLTFSGNTAGKYGGAIGYFERLSGDNNTLTFTGNTAGTDGGAICSDTLVIFSGNNTVTFTGNKAGRKGNDIYLGDLSIRPANLTFSSGTYSFDGGIWLADETASTIISDGAKVTIAGRNDDSVNEYEFRDVALTANLTATVDDIEYLHGNFTAGENGLMTIKKGSDTATIKSSTNYGVMDLLINKAEEVETISISSGRIDIKGCIDATIELQNDAEHPTTFSPGNSVGHVDIDGAFILNAGTTLLIEMDATGIDTMAATSFDLDNGTISFTLSDEIPGGASYDILTAKNGTPFDEDIITRMLNGQTLPEYYTLALAGPSNNIVRFSIDRNAVPEPSTWALLILGAAGLAYMRKRSRQ